MPPFPSISMIRYRPSSSAPGAKRPWLRPSDEESQPVADLGTAAAGVGVRRLTTPIGPLCACGGETPVVPIVMAFVTERARPQAGQNRAVSGASLPQPGQVT